MSNFNRNDLPDNKGAIFEHWDAELDFFYEDKILVLGDSLFLGLNFLLFIFQFPLSLG